MSRWSWSASARSGTDDTSGEPLDEPLDDSADGTWRSAPTRSSAADWIASARSATRSPSSPPTRRTHGSTTWVVDLDVASELVGERLDGSVASGAVAARRCEQGRHQLVVGEIELVADVDQDRAVGPVDELDTVDTVAVTRSRNRLRIGDAPVAAASWRRRGLTSTGVSPR